MPVDLVSTSAFICERILREEDGALSAIRIVDVFYVPATEQIAEDAVHNLIAKINAVNFHLVVVLRSKTEGQARLNLSFINPAGDESPIKMHGVPEMLVFKSNFPGTKIPPSQTLNLHLGLPIRPLGTYLALVRLDEQIVTSVPFTLLVHPSQS